MPENKWVPVWAGRTMGYPKYIADRVSLERHGDVWRGEVRHKGIPRFVLELSPDKAEPPTWVAQVQHPELGPILNLNPPSEGPRVQVVRTVVPEGAEPSQEILEGTATMTIGRALAVELARRGQQVFASARRP